MAVTITEYTPTHEPEVKAFNQRVQEHGIEFRLPKTSVSPWLPKKPNHPVFMEFWLALENETVRGGYKLRHQNFILRDEELMAANYQGPLSEGTYDRKYMMVGAQLLRSALQKQPLLYALGMGGTEQPLPKILKASGWSIDLVPFLFRVIRAGNFLRNIQPLHRTKGRSIAAKIAAATGLGAIGIGVLTAVKRKKRADKNLKCEQVKVFGPWSNDIWQQAKQNYLFSAVRDQASQNIIFPENDVKNIKLCMRHGDSVFGWAVVRCTQMQGDKYFGNMKLGSVVDCFALPGREFDVIELATQYLAEAGADLVITNQSHSTWVNALKDAAYLNGPSNFAFACSPKLTERLGPLNESLGKIHFNRSDGDGPIHL